MYVSEMNLFHNHLYFCSFILKRLMISIQSDIQTLRVGVMESVARAMSKTIFFGGEIGFLNIY